MKHILLLSLIVLLIQSCIPDRELPNPWEGTPASQEILVTTPGGGETVRIDSTYVINWYYRGDLNDSTLFDIYLLHEDTVASVIVSDLDCYSSTTFRWTPSRNYKADSDRYRIFISEHNNSSQGDTSAYFTMISPYYGGYDVSVTYIDSYSDSLDIAWTTTGYPGERVKVQIYHDTAYLFTLRDSLWDHGDYTWRYLEDLFIDGEYRVKVQSFQDSTISGFSTPFSLEGGVHQDSYEPDNHLTTVKAITPGEKQQRSSYLWDVDWVSFQCQLGKSYQLRTSNNEQLRLKIYGQDTTLLLAADTTSDTAMVSFTPTAKGTYYAQITHDFRTYSFDATYSLLLNEYNPLHAAKVTKPLLGDTLTAGTIDSIYWEEILPMYRYVHIELLRDSTVLYSIDTSSYNYYNKVSWSVPSWTESGTYRIKITDTQNDSLFTISDPFYIKGVSNDAHEVNNSHGTATAISENYLLGGILTIGDEDWYRIPVKAGRTYGVRINPEVRVVVSLLNSSQLMYSSEAIYGETVVSLKVVTDDELYIKVDDGDKKEFSGYGGAYSLTVESLDSDSLITFIDPGEKSVMAIGEMKEIVWSAPFMESRIYIDLYKDNTLITPVATYLKKEINSYIWTVINGLESGSDYRMKLYSKSDTSLYCFSAPFTISGLLPDAFEVDQPHGLASLYEQWETKDIHTITLGDTDWIKVPVDPNYRYTTAVTSDFVAVVKQYRGSPSTLLKSFYCNDTSVVESYSPVISDTMLVSISGNDTIDGGTYEISFYQTPKDSLITLVNPTEHSIFAAGESYNVEWNAPAIDGNLNILLLKGDSLLYTFSNVTNNGSYSLTLNSSYATGSDYRFKIEDRSDVTVYAFSDMFTISGILPDSYEPDNEKSLATAIGIDGVVQSRTLTFDDNDWVTFTMKKDSLYKIGVDLIAPKSNLIGVTLMDNDMNTLFKHSVNTSHLWLCEKSGPYYVRINHEHDYSSFYGNYELSVAGYSSETYKSVVTLPGDTLLSDGTTSLITWSNWDLLGSSVDLFLLKDGAVVATIEANLSNEGSYNWSVPATLAKGSGYSVKVISKWKSLLQGESTLFTIN